MSWRKSSKISPSSPGTDDIFSEDSLSSAQRSRLQAAFELFDADKSGQISAPEMLQALRLLGASPTNAEFGEMLKAIDSNNDGVVDFREFALVWWKREKERLEADFDTELTMAFKVFDSDNSGSISLTELKEKLTTLGEKMTDDEVQELLTECDKDGSGTISYEEFKNLPCWQS